MTNKVNTFIFFGRSGCGKGTQIKLLENYLKKINPELEIFSYSTGEGFRNLFKNENFASKLASEITEAGLLQPLFLSVSLWGNSFLKEIKEDNHIIIDGFPRRENESALLDEALTFFKRDNIILIDLLVSRETSMRRMLSRGRDDDTQENAQIRLDWYEKDVVPAVNYFKDKIKYTYLEIDGEEEIETIGKNIINKIAPYIN